MEIAKELRRDKEFTKRLLIELKEKGVIDQIKKNNKGKDYIKRSRWIINPEVLNNYNEL